MKSLLNEVIEESNLRAMNKKAAKKADTFTNSNVSASSYNSRWEIYSKSSSKSGNKVSAITVAKYYLDGTVISTGTKTVTLTCSSTGVLS